MNGGTARRDRAGRGAHICMVVDGREPFRAAAIDFLADGLHRGERLMYVADRPRHELATDLAPLGDVESLSAGGALDIVSTAGVYGPTFSFDPDEQVDRYRRLTVSAIGDGYSGLRVAADATALIGDDTARRRFIAYELAVDRLMAEMPMAALCAYDRREVGSVAGELCAVHPADDAPAEVVPGFRLAFGPHGGLELSGEIDLDNQALFATALEAAAGCVDPDAVIDASALDFIDVRGMSALDRLSWRMRASGGRLRIGNPPPILAKCASLLDLDDLLAALTAEAP